MNRAMDMDLREIATRILAARDWGQVSDLVEFLEEKGIVSLDPGIWEELIEEVAEGILGGPEKAQEAVERFRRDFIANLMYGADDLGTINEEEAEEWFKVLLNEFPEDIPFGNADEFMELWNEMV